MGTFDFIARGRSGTRSDRTAASWPAVQKAPRPARPTIRLRDWLTTLVVALLVALFIRAFLIEAFRIPTSSMEKSLLVGDFVLVSKLHYGPRVPITIGVPFTDIHLPAVELPAWRMPGLSEPRRGDIIVFNFPGEEKPIDRKTHYIKRIIGMPGDTLSIVNKVTYVNGLEMPLDGGMQQKWVVFHRPGARIPMDRLRERGVEEINALGRRFEGVAFESTVALAREVATWDEIASVEPYVAPGDPSYAMNVFPSGSGFARDNYGPLYVPARGDTLRLSSYTWPAYAEIINRFEGHDAGPMADGSFRIDGVRTNRYVVEQDYFFVMGDNRDSSYDSRIWGFVPMSHVVGKAVLIYFSWDRKENRTRTERLFEPIG